MRVFLIFFSCFLFSSCYITKALKYKKYPLDKLDEFSAETFEKSENPFHFYRSSISQKDKKSLDSTLTGSNKYAVAVIRNDSILYEWYNEAQNVDTASILPSFSVAKSYVSTMIQIAKQEGEIKSFNLPITDFLPELLKRDERFKQITIQHLLDMRSGIKSSEDYLNPRSEVLKLGFAKNINPKTLKASIESEPDRKFEYRSQNTQLLAMILERATGMKTQDFFREKLLKPLRMEHSSSWIYDDEKHKTLRAFCCMNQSILDYAKFGKLYLDGGVFEGKKIIHKEWVDGIFNNESRKKYEGYKNQFWSIHSYHISHSPEQYKQQLDKYRNEIVDIATYKNDTIQNRAIHTIKKDAIMCKGLLKQYIKMYKDQNIIVVHFGNSLNESKPLKKNFRTELERIFDL